MTTCIDLWPSLVSKKDRSNYAQLDKNRHNDNDQHHQPS